MQHIRENMDEESQRAIAVWAFYILLFLILGAFLYMQGQLTIGFISLYWFPAVILTIIGTIPPPWEPFV